MGAGQWTGEGADWLFGDVLNPDWSIGLPFEVEKVVWGMGGSNLRLTCGLERSCFEGSELGVVRLQRQAATTLQPRAARGSRGGGPQRRIIEAFLVWRGKWSVKEKSRA